jgi:hypothetical protein
MTSITRRRLRPKTLREAKQRPRALSAAAPVP